MSKDTWTPRDLPVLEAIVELADEGERHISPEAIAGRSGLEIAQVEVALVALANESPPLFHATEFDEWGGKRTFMTVEQPTGEARRRVGAWPTSEGLADRLVAALGVAAAAEPDSTKKSRLQSVADFFGGVGRDVLVRVVSETLTRSM